MTNMLAKLSLLSLLAAPAFAGTPLVNCQVIDGEQTVDLALNSDHGTEAVSVKTLEGYVLTFGLMRKFGDYDTYPNVALKVEKEGVTLFTSVMIGSRDEYGSFTIGSAYGSCTSVVPLP